MQNLIERFMAMYYTGVEHGRQLERQERDIADLRAALSSSEEVHNA